MCIIHTLIRCFSGTLTNSRWIFLCCFTCVSCSCYHNVFRKQARQHLEIQYGSSAALSNNHIWWVEPDHNFYRWEVRIKKNSIGALKTYKYLSGVKEILHCRYLSFLRSFVIFEELICTVLGGVLGTIDYVK